MLLVIAHAIDLIAVSILIIGFAVSLGVFAPQMLRAYQQHSGKEAFMVFRRMRWSLGQVLLLALEVLIVSDIIFSVAHRSLDDIAILGATVLIRIALSYFLNVELDHLEKQRGEVE